MMSKLLLHRVLSYLLFVVLVGFLVCSVRFQRMPNSLLNNVGQLIGGYLANIAQAVMGGSRQNSHGGDVVAFLMFLIMLIDLIRVITRHSNRLYWFQHWAATHLSLSPTNMITLSFGIALSYHNAVAATADNVVPHAAHPPNYVQLLILLIFSTAMYSLFSASDPPGYNELSICSRLTSRVMEYSMYSCFFPNYPTIWCWQIMAPLGLLVCVSRSNQIFRIWQNNQESYHDFHDHVIVKQKFQRLYELASERIEKSLDKIHWSSSTSRYRGFSTDREENNENRLETLIKEVKKAGMYSYKAWKPYSQYCFFWSAGSGVLLCSGITLNTMMLITAFQLHTRVSAGWNVMGIAPIAGIFLFLPYRSMPAFVVFVADINDPNPDWRVWFHQIRTFMRVLVTEGLPLMMMREFEQEAPWYVAVLHGSEGLELVSYVVVYALARLIGLGLLFCILTLARKMKLGIALHWVWSKLEPDLAFYSAKITAPDVIRVKSAILQAEYALDTRIQPACTATPTIHPQGSNIRCIHLRYVKVLLEDLNKALRGEPNNSGFSTDQSHVVTLIDDDESKQLDDEEKQDNERKQAIAAGLYKSTMDNLKELKDIGFAADIAVRLHPILGLLHRLHLDKPRCEAENLSRVVDMLNSFTDNCLARRHSNPCSINETDVKLMRVQLQASMLLYHFDEPSILHSITGVTLHEWLEIRRRVPGIDFCDFIH